MHSYKSGNVRDKYADITKPRETYVLRGFDFPVQESTAD
jgi:hypothetical protein